MPKLRTGSYFPEWLLTRRRRAEQALTSVVVTCYLLGASTRRMDELVQSLGITSLSRSQVSEMAKASTGRWKRSAPARCTPARTRSSPPTRNDKGPRAGRVVHAVVLGATGFNGGGYREVLGCHVATSETAAAWLAFFKDLVVRGLGGCGW